MWLFLHVNILKDEPYVAVCRRVIWNAKDRSPHSQTRWSQLDLHFAHDLYGKAK